eukprot:2022299-Rhodomonas_salina.1
MQDSGSGADTTDVKVDLPVESTKDSDSSATPAHASAHLGQHAEVDLDCMENGNSRTSPATLQLLPEVRRAGVEEHNRGEATRLEGCSMAPGEQDVTVRGSWADTKDIGEGTQARDSSQTVVQGFRESKTTGKLVPGPTRKSIGRPPRFVIA